MKRLSKKQFSELSNELYMAMDKMNIQSRNEELTWEDADKQAFKDIQEKFGITLNAEHIKYHCFDNEFGWYVNDWHATDYIL